MVKRLFNILVIGILLTFILCVTAFFFLGSKETADSQLDKLPKYFLGRTSAGVIIGILGSLVIALANILLNKGQTDRRLRVIRITILTLFLSVVSSLIGATIFFYH